MPTRKFTVPPSNYWDGNTFVVPGYTPGYGAPPGTGNPVNQGPREPRPRPWGPGQRPGSIVGNIINGTPTRFSPFLGTPTFGNFSPNFGAPTIPATTSISPFVSPFQTSMRSFGAGLLDIPFTRFR